MNRFDLQKQIEQQPEAKLKDLIMKMLFDDIISLKIAPGSRINVNQIASAMGISRTPVVEAVAGLTEAGFIVNRPEASGSYVLELSLKDMISLYQVRDAIESEAAFLCAHNAEDSTIRELTRLADAFRDSVIMHDIRGMKDTDMPFHRMIIESCGNTYLIRSYEQIVPYLTRYQASMLEFIGRSSNDQNPWLSGVKYNHTALVSAIRLRLPELARQSMKDHIASSLNFTSMSGEGVDPFASAK
ncbi:MAG: GntR family transcriptional regulator [Lachnospiraceae bacterium]|nr:GntR family transcriptional regulator [Lachnospiraceae bacterium]MBR2561902.1 GntR family transcriptional regulator [Eubacterium sp.]